MPAAPSPDERPDERADAADADPGPAIEVPDDASALDADRLRYLDEKARGVNADDGPDWSIREPAPTLPSFMRTARFERFGLSGPLVVTVLVVVGIVGSLMTTMRPQMGDAPGPLPLAIGSSAVPGTVGGLLPAAPVTLDGVPLGLTRLRPAVLVVVPPDCLTCSATVRTVADQAREFRLRTLLVGAPAQSDQLLALSRESTGRIAAVVLDQDAAFTSLYPGTTPTVVLVHADGIIADVIEDPSPGIRLEGVIATLPDAARASR